MTVATLTQYRLALPTFNMTFVDWFSQLSNELPTFDIPRADSEDDWVELAQLLMRNQECDRFNCPWPDGFNNWRDWAERFIAAFGGQA